MKWWIWARIRKALPVIIPRWLYKVAMEVVRNPGSRGILLCMTGIGHSIAANKVPGVYAALVYNKEAAAAFPSAQ